MDAQRTHGCRMYRGGLMSVSFEKIGETWSWVATTNRVLRCSGDGLPTFDDAMLSAANACNDVTGSKGRWWRRPSV
jgi:hypothetical protein